MYIITHIHDRVLSLYISTSKACNAKKENASQVVFLCGTYVKVWPQDNPHPPSPPTPSLLPFFIAYVLTLAVIAHVEQPEAY